SSLTALIDHWEEIVGRELAGATSPMKIEGDTVTVRCDRAPYSSHLKLHWEEFRAVGTSLGIDVPNSLTVVLKPK
ncbi:MAG: DciA family protein, partial [Actinomycetota bacterium]